MLRHNGLILFFKSLFFFITQAFHGVNLFIKFRSHQVVFRRKQIRLCLGNDLVGTFVGHEKSRCRTLFFKIQDLPEIPVNVRKQSQIMFHILFAIESVFS